MTLPFTDDCGKNAKSKLLQKIQDNKIVKKVSDKGAKLQDKGAKLWYFLKVTLKNHGWYYGDGGALEAWPASIDAADETNS
ncbi:hypothetical protein JMJ35_000368 [Cladonia borealis]|uniref:Uncharacterized protein n=1 Tax=Cladonia borealis TaxID=184061 RepID=A0AA39V5I4_9LECA|nr:hypothetical protein JMJ35_000368 [Cladonia borealis]